MRRFGFGKRIISIALAGIVLFSSMPVDAYADEIVFEEDYINAESFEEELMAEEFIEDGQEEELTDEPITNDVLSDEVSADDALTEEVLTEEVLSEEALTEEVLTEEVLSEEVLEEEISEEELLQEELLGEDCLEEEILEEEYIEEVPDEIQLDGELCEDEECFELDGSSKKVEVKFCYTENHVDFTLETAGEVIINPTSVGHSYTPLLPTSKCNTYDLYTLSTGVTYRFRVKGRDNCTLKLVRTVWDGKSTSYENIVNNGCEFLFAPPSSGELQIETNGPYTPPTIKPSWCNSSPSVSVATATDTGFLFKMTAPAGLTPDENCYYKINFSKNANTRFPAGRDIILSDETVYLAAKDYETAGNSDANFVYAFKEWTSFVPGGYQLITEPGKGLGISLNVSVSLVQLRDKEFDGDEPSPDVAEDVVAKSLSRVITVSTKSPYYPEKFTINKTKSQLYSARESIVAASVDFGKNATYITSDTWTVESDNPNLEVYNSSDDRCVSDDRFDNKIYITAHGAGTYKITVRSIRDISLVKEFSVKVAASIQTLDIEGPEAIYKPAGKSTSVKTVVSANSSLDDKIKNPKVRYSVIGAKSASMLVDTVNSSYAKIDSKGKITLGKNCPYNEITVKVCAADYTGNEVCAEKTIEIVNKGTGIKAVKAYLKTPGYDIYDEIKGPVPADRYEDVCFKLYSNKQCKPEQLIFSCDPKDGKTNSENIYFPTIKYPTKSGKVSYTISALDGSKAKVTVNYTYCSDNDLYDSIYLNEYGKYISQAGEEESQYDTLNDTEFILEKKTCDSTFVVSLSKGIRKSDMASGLTEGKITFKNCKIINKNDGIIRICMTASPATITLSKKTVNENGKSVTRKKSWKLVNDNFRKVSAPKATQDKGTVVYANYLYSSIEPKMLTFKLGKPINGVSFCKVTENLGKQKNLPQNTQIDSVIYRQQEEKGKTVGYIDLKLKSNDGNLFTQTGTYAVYINPLGGTNDAPEVLTKSPIILKISVKNFKKSISFNTSFSLYKNKPVAVKLKKSVGVKSYEIEKLCDANIKGRYNDFSNLFETYSDENGVPAIRLKNQGNGIYAAPGKYQGYISYKVTFADGDIKKYVSKITVNVK